MDLVAELGRRVRAHRIQLKLSQREAARLLGVGERTLQYWESGTTLPWSKHRRAIERFLETENEPA